MKAEGKDANVTGQSRGPGNILNLLTEIPGNTQGCVVVKEARLGKVESIVNDLSSVDHVDGGVVLQQLLGQHVPVLLVIVNPGNSIIYQRSVLFTILAAQTCNIQSAEH